MNKIIPLKRYGQNFLIDKNILEFIISRSDLSLNDNILEIGAGKGFLTNALLEKNISFLHSVEIDERFKNELSKLENTHQNFKIHWADALKINYDTFNPFPNKIIANIPYNITTPLIWNFLKYASKGLNYHLYMVQKEAAERLTAKPDSKARYPLGITLEIMGSVEIVKNVSRKCFRPVPEVESCLIEIKLNRNFELSNNELWSEFLHKAFSQRRKTLINNLENFRKISRLDFENIFSDLKIDSKIRAEDLDSDSWLKIYNSILRFKT